MSKASITPLPSEVKPRTWAEQILKVSGDSLCLTADTSEETIAEYECDHQDFLRSAARLLHQSSLHGLLRGLEELNIKSPIEEMLFVALCLAADYRGASYSWGVVGRDGALGAEFGPHCATLYQELLIIPQYSFSTYRIDFLLDYEDRYLEHMGRKHNSRLFVECDGHAFHEKTKAQAEHDKKRDRVLQQSHKVFHFTGSEIWADAVGCAAQCLEALERELKR